MSSITKTSIVGLLALLVLTAMPLQGSVVQNLNQVSQYGITWKFDKNYQVGQFANGDYWVVGPVSITQITPGWDGEKHGSMINPIPSPAGKKEQGYDSRMQETTFSSKLLVQAPVTLQPNTSIVSTIGWVQGEAGYPDHDGFPRPALKVAAVLTVLGQVPPDNGATVFRPPYVGTSKPLYSTVGLRKDLLANLPLIANTPNPTTLGVDESMERLWLDHFPGGSDYTQYTSPTNNMPRYGRDYALAVGKMSLLLNCDENKWVSNFGINKDIYIIRFTQIGIDLYHTAQNGGTWYPNGGLNSGRKWPILFAGLMLNNADMKNVGTWCTHPEGMMEFNGEAKSFHEDFQTFYVRETSKGVYNYGYGGYTAADVGLPEWREMHYDVTGDKKDWTVNDYRLCCNGNGWAGIALAMRIMNAKALYSHDAFFDYMDRFMSVQEQLGGGGDVYYIQADAWTRAMWDTYRANYGCVWTRSNPSDIYSNGSNGCDSNTPPPPSKKPPIADAGSDQTVTDSDNSGSEQVALNGSSSSDPDGNIVSYVWTENGSQIATNVRPTVPLSVGQHTITLLVTDNDGLTDTDTVVVTVNPGSSGNDTTPPSILSVTASNIAVEVQFNEALDEASATNTANYSLNNGLIIDSIWPELAYNRVTLYTTTEHQDGITYTLTVTNVKDTAGNAMPRTTRSYTYTEGLVGHWVFDTASGNSVADTSGHNNTATLLNGAQLTSAGEAGLSGADDCVQIPTTSWNTNEGSVALWANAQDLSGVKYLFGHNVGSWTNTIQLYTDEGNLCVGLGGNHSLATNIQTLSTNTWYHIALTWDGTNYVVYVDGTAKNSGTYSALTSLNSSADIGNNGNSSSRDEAFTGLIDEARVYSRALADTEVYELAMVFLPIGDKTVAEGSQLSFSIRTKPGVNVALSDQNLPSLPSFASNTFSWTPDYTDAGTYEVEFTAPHGSAVDYEKVAITVTNVQPPDTNSADPIGYWKFDETSGDIAVDSSATGNTGYLRNGLTWSSGKFNGAVVFSVPNDAVEIQTTNFNAASGTIAMWVYVQRLTLSRHYLFGHDTESATNRIQLYLKYGNLSVGLGNSNETSTNIQKLQFRRWYHVALTWSGTDYNVYVNGSLKASGTFPGLTEFADHADIGNNGISRDKALNGRIDDVRIFDHALNLDEISKLMSGN